LGLLHDIIKYILTFNCTLPDILKHLKEQFQDSAVSEFQGDSFKYFAQELEYL
jgi:hypothetical protein